MKLRQQILSTLLGIVISAFCFAVTIPPAGTFSKETLSSPVGYWLTIDDKTDQPRGIVQIYATKGKDSTVTLEGKTLAGLYIPGNQWRENCSGCIQPWTDKPINGMTFMWNFTQQGTDKTSPWSKGKIFDIDSNSKIYNAKMWLGDDGKSLNVRGYIAVFFRTQTWQRLDKAQVDAYKQKMEEQIKEHPMN